MGSQMINPIHPDILPKMDPQFVKIYNEYQAPRVRADQVTIEEYRADMSRYTIAIVPGPEPVTGSDKIYQVPVKNPDGEIPVQVFVPTEDAIAKGGMKGGDGKLPAHVNYHGGGWVIGSLKSDESWCRQMCQETGMIIVNVDYRLAPEYPYPISLIDSWEALVWVIENSENLGIDKNRVGTGGLSAGAHISAALSIMARDDKEKKLPPLKLQFLCVGCYDLRQIPIGLDDGVPDDTPYETMKSLHFAPCLPIHRMIWFANLYLGTDAQKRKKAAEEWQCSPILAKSHKNLAPATFHVAEIDPLCDQNEAYHKLLQDNGVSSKFHLYKGVGHPFGHWDGELEKAKEYIRKSIIDLKEAYAK